MATKIQLARIDKKVTDLSDALAKLGRGTDLRELLRIIRRPGWTTPAELAFTVAILNSMQVQVSQLSESSDALGKAAKQVTTQGLTKK